MADTWELIKYVESHPENHNQRWRLIKKLYKEADYRMALENLQILINDWEPKPNVCRYLGATYSRLSRPDEAVGILEKGAELFPTDLALREQLAVAYASAGDNDRSTAIWESLAEANPDHPYASKAVRKTKQRMQDNHDEKVSSQPASSGIVCRSCGARNAPDARSCEVCEMSIDMLDDIIGEADVLDEVPVDHTRWILWASIIGCLAFIVFSLKAAMAHSSYEVDSPFATATSLGEFMRVEHMHLYWTLTGVLLVAWPFLLTSAHVAAGLQSVRTDRVVRQGFAFSTFAIAFAWISGVGLLEWIPVTLAVTLAGIVVSHKKNVKVALAVWAIHWMFLGVLIAALVGAIMGGGFLADSIALDRAWRQDSQRNALHYEGALNTPQSFQWASSGSVWLDEHAPRVGVYLSVAPELITQEMTLVVKQGDVLHLYERVYDAEQFFYMDQAKPEVEYTVELMESGGEEPVRLDIVGLLPVGFK